MPLADGEDHVSLLLEVCEYHSSAIESTNRRESVLGSSDQSLHTRLTEV